MLTGCGNQTVAEVTEVTQETAPASAEVPMGVLPVEDPYPYESRFDDTTLIQLSDDGIIVEGNEEAVYTSNDIVYYEDRDTYESGNPYGEGETHEKHTAEEAAAHTVVNITQSGAYILSGTLSAGQIRIDLGKDAYDDPNAVVELILDDVDITCTVAPAIVFENVYECDGNWSEDEARPDVDTSAAGANLILSSTGNRISGSHVAKIFKDTEDEKKLWKQDGAIYSYMSMNVYGPGSLELTADNEGLGTELHLTINGGDIRICSDNDGINTNEDNVSVTTINGGTLRIDAGLGAEGDGIDSNGFLVINGGTVIASANPAADAGLDSDLGSYIHGGTVIALGSVMNWAESDSNQVTMNLQFAQQQAAGSKIVITGEDGTEIFSFEDDGENARAFSGLILSHAAFTVGETYQLYVDGVQMQYTGTDVGGFGGGRMPGGFEPGQMPEGMELPEGFTPGEIPADFTLPEGETMPEDFDPSRFGGRGPRGDGEDRQPPENFDGERPTLPEGETRPEGETMPEGEWPGRGGKGGRNGQSGEPSTEFYLTDKVNAFSGITAVTA